MPSRATDPHERPTGSTPSVPDIVLTRAVEGEAAGVLSPDALRFVADLTRRFEPERARLLQARRERQVRIDAGELPEFLPGTRSVRESEWSVAPTPIEGTRQKQSAAAD